MTSPYEHLIAAIVETGISEGEARHAARRCAFAMAKGGGVGYTTGYALAYFLAPVGATPITVLPYMGAASTIMAGATLAGAGTAFARAPQCSQVREAIRYWSFAKI